jgi:peroxiredoxin
MGDAVKTFRFGLALLLSVAVFAESPTDPPAVRVAPPAPLFELNDLRGARVKLAECHSAAVIVTFFLSGDRPSQRQIQPLRALREKHPAADLAVFGIALDAGPGAELQAQVAQWQVNFPVLRFDLKTLEGFGGITAVPTTFVLDRHRNIIQRHVGYVEPVVLETDLNIIWKK